MKQTDAESLRADELSLEGRLIQVVRALSRDELRKKKEEEAKREGDKRNEYLAKEGLVNTQDFEHKGVSDKDMQTRVRLLKSKNEALKK